MITAKFGGSSLADAAAWRQVRAILDMDRDRRYIVVSAPGKRNGGDDKITDLLYRCLAQAQAGEAIDADFDRIARRYLDIARELEIASDLPLWLNEVKAAMQAGATREYAASRGEYLCARLFAAYLDVPFVDAATAVCFDMAGNTDYEATNAALAQALSPLPRAVIPGFYGSDPQGDIRTFSRGGSDVTGALVACALNVDLYENWTDVTGFRAADPRIVPDAGFIAHMTYRELRELSYMGASVLHEDAVFPVRKVGIPTSLRNTFDPLHPGTTIHYSGSRQGLQSQVTGIAGQKGYTLISLEKDRMNVEVGFGRRVLQVFEDYGINFEHLPTGIDTLCVVVHADSFDHRKEEIIERLVAVAEPDNITVDDHLAMIATVGTGMKNQFGIAARLFTALWEHGINVKTLSQVPSEISIIVGLREEDLSAGIRAIYDAFLRS